MLPKEIEALVSELVQASRDAGWSWMEEALSYRRAEDEDAQSSAQAALEAAILAYGEEARREAVRVRRALRSVLDSHADCDDGSGTICPACAIAMAELSALTSPSPVEGDGARGESVRDYVVRICDGCRRLEGKMCSTPGCAFCFRSVSEVAAALDAILLRPVVDGERLDLMTPTAEPAPAEPESGGTAPDPKAITNERSQS